MSDRSTIEWTQATWNPVTGCTKLSPASPGCANCYASTFAERFRGTPGHYFEHGFDVQLRPDKLDQPLRWRRPRKIFVNSMSDLFHDSVPDWFIANVFGVMSLASRHTFQVLTKRHARMRSLLSSSDVTGQGHSFEAMIRNVHHNLRNNYSLIDAPLAEEITWPLPNVWLGVSAENQQWADIRIPALLDTPAAVRFVSAEPLLGPTTLNLLWLSPPVTLQGQATTEERAALARFCREQAAKAGGWAPFIDWVIVGGESGRGARPMHPDWARGLRDQCQAAGVAFFLKQWGEYIPGPSANAEPVDLYVERESGRTATGDQFWHINGGHWWGVRRVGKKSAGRVLDGRTWDEYPAVAQS